MFVSIVLYIFLILSIINIFLLFLKKGTTKKELLTILLYTTFIFITIWALNEWRTQPRFVKIEQWYENIYDAKPESLISTQVLNIKDYVGFDTIPIKFKSNTLFILIEKSFNKKN